MTKHLKVRKVKARAKTRSTFKAGLNPRLVQRITSKIRKTRGR